MGMVVLKRKPSVYMFAIILLILASLSLAQVSSPKIMSTETIIVPDDYEKIQWAIGNASAGETIFVRAGTYYENVVIVKSLTPKGAGSDITIIDGGGKRAGVKITADNEFTGDKVTIKRLSSSICISASPAAVIVGDSTTINGSIIPIRVEVNVTIHYKPFEGNWSTLKAVMTDAYGCYSYEWTPTTTGTYEVKASWPGDATTLPAESDGVKTVRAKDPATKVHLYAAAAIAVIIIASATVVYILRVRKPKSAHKPRE